MTDKSSLGFQTDGPSSGVYRYIELIRWLFVDSVIRFRWRCLKIVTSGVLATILELNAIALVVYYGGLLSKGESFDYFSDSLEARDSLQLLIAVAIFTFLFLIGSALLTWYSRLSTLRLRKLYELFCSRRALKLISSGSLFPINSDGEPVDDAFIMRITRMDARYCGRIMVALLTSLSPLVIATIACVGLFVIDPILSSGIFILLGIASVSMWRIGIAGARASVEIEKGQRLTGRVYKQAVQLLKSSSADCAGNDSWLDEKVFKDPVVDDYYKFYEKRLRVTEHSQFASNTLLASSILAIVIVLGHQAISTNTGWEQLVIYLLALRYALVNVKRIFTKLTNINRFYPQLRRYLDFVLNVKSVNQNREIAMSIQLESPQIGGSLTQLDLGHEAPNSIIWNVPLSTVSAFSLVRKLFVDPDEGSGTINAFWVIGHEPKLLQGKEFNLNDLGVNQESLNLELKKLFNELSGRKDLSRAQQRIAYSFLAAISNKKQGILVDSTAIDNAEQFISIQNKYGSELVILVVYHQIVDQLPKFNESHIIAVGKEGIEGMGDLTWFKSHLDEITALTTTGTGLGEDLDDDEDDEDDE